MVGGDCCMRSLVEERFCHWRNGVLTIVVSSPWRHRLVVQELGAQGQQISGMHVMTSVFFPHGRHCQLIVMRSPANLLNTGLHATLQEGWNLCVRENLLSSAGSVIVWWGRKLAVIQHSWLLKPQCMGQTTNSTETPAFQLTLFRVGSV